MSDRMADRNSNPTCQTEWQIDISSSMSERMGHPEWQIDRKFKYHVR
jgi:hypothetical protein